MRRHGCKLLILPPAITERGAPFPVSAFNENECLTQNAIVKTPCPATILTTFPGSLQRLKRLAS